MLIGCGLLMGIAGCHKRAPSGAAASTENSSSAPSAGTAAAAPTASEWTPIVKGLPYQLSLAKGVFGFCDDSGSQRIDLATGKQTAGTQTCDRTNEVVQSSCDDRVTIYGQTDGGQDNLNVFKHDYLLAGHSRECDLDGPLLIISTVGAVEMIDTATQKILAVDPAGGDKVAIGSGWVAWSSLDDKHPLRLETTGWALAHGTKPTS